MLINVSIDYSFFLHNMLLKCLSILQVRKKWRVVNIYIYIYLQGFLLRVETRMVFYIDIFSGPGHHGLEDVSIKKASGPIGWTVNWPASNVSGFIAQLVEHRTGNREVTGSNPVEVLNFFQTSLRNCINCVHCDDHFFVFILISHCHVVVLFRSRVDLKGPDGVLLLCSTL